MTEEKISQCEGCIYRIVGERKDRRGYVLTTSACLCEEKMAAGCIPTYQFSDSYIYKGKIKTEKGFIIFKHGKKLRDNVRIVCPIKGVSEDCKNCTQMDYGSCVYWKVYLDRKKPSKSSPYIPLA